MKKLIIEDKKRIEDIELALRLFNYTLINLNKEIDLISNKKIRNNLKGYASEISEQEIEFEMQLKKWT